MGKGRGQLTGSPMYTFLKEAPTRWKAPTRRGEEGGARGTGENPAWTHSILLASSLLLMVSYGLRNFLGKAKQHNYFHCGQTLVSLSGVSKVVFVWRWSTMVFVWRWSTMVFVWRWSTMVFVWRWSTMVFVWRWSTMVFVWRWSTMVFMWRSYRAKLSRV